MVKCIDLVTRYLLLKVLQSAKMSSAHKELYEEYSDINVSQLWIWLWN